MASALKSCRKRTHLIRSINKSFQKLQKLRNEIIWQKQEVKSTKKSNSRGPALKYCFTAWLPTASALKWRRKRKHSIKCTNKLLKSSKIKASKSMAKAPKIKLNSIKPTHLQNSFYKTKTKFEYNQFFSIIIGLFWLLIEDKDGCQSWSMRGVEG